MMLKRYRMHGEIQAVYNRDSETYTAMLAPSVAAVWTKVVFEAYTTPVDETPVSEMADETDMPEPPEPVDHEPDTSCMRYRALSAALQTHNTNTLLSPVCGVDAVLAAATRFEAYLRFGQVDDIRKDERMNATQAVARDGMAEKAAVEARRAVWQEPMPYARDGTFNGA